MPKLANKLQVEIIYFNRYIETMKFKNSWRFIKIDEDFFADMHFMGLEFKEICVFQKLLLIGFRQRSSVFTVFIDSFKPFLPDFEKVLRTLESHNIIRLGGDIIIYNNINKGTGDKVSTETLNLTFKNMGKILEEKSKEKS